MTDYNRGAQGVNYSELDPFKIAAQRAAASTAHNLEDYFGYHEVVESRGESAYVWYEGDKYQAIVTEGLGTKNLVADQLFREIKDASSNLSAIANEVNRTTARTHYDAVAQDTVAMIVNDLIVVGAMPKVITAHMSVAESAWFNDVRRSQDLINGWVAACNMAGATWGAGETPALKGILQPNVIELSGSAAGEIKPLSRLTLGDKLQPGDSIIYLPSSGIHANGLTGARELGDNLPEGYLTPLSDGSSYGESLLTPTPIYVDAVRSLFRDGVDIHYMANVTGHGWRKLMRAEKDLTYVLNLPPRPQPIFDFIQERTGVSEEEMYKSFNMGMGFGIYVARNDLSKALSTLQGRGWPARLGGHVEAGPKQVIIGPKGITFKADSLEIR